MSLACFGSLVLLVLALAGTIFLRPANSFRILCRPGLVSHPSNSPTALPSPPFCLQYLPVAPTPSFASRVATLAHVSSLSLNSWDPEDELSVGVLRRGGELQGKLLLRFLSFHISLSLEPLKPLKSAAFDCITLHQPAPLKRLLASLPLERPWSRVPPQRTILVARAALRHTSALLRRSAQRTLAVTRPRRLPAPTEPPAPPRFISQNPRSSPHATEAAAADAKHCTDCPQAIRARARPSHHALHLLPPPSFLNMSIDTLVPEVHVNVANLPPLLPWSLRYNDLYPYSDLFSHIVSTRPGCPRWNAELEAYHQTFHPEVWLYLSIDRDGDAHALRQLRSRLGEAEAGA